MPTLVSNVETLANLPYLQRHGSAAFRSPGTSLCTGHLPCDHHEHMDHRPPLELPLGLPFTELLALHGVSPNDVRGALMGGYFAGLLDRSVLGTTLDHETFRGLGSGLGCGAVGILTDDCAVAVAAAVLACFDRERRRTVRGSCFDRHRRDGRRRRRCAARRREPTTETVPAGPARAVWCCAGPGACATLDGAWPASRRACSSTSRNSSSSTLPVSAEDVPKRCAARHSVRTRCEAAVQSSAETSECRLDRTICDGCGACAEHAPEYLLSLTTGDTPRSSVTVACPRLTATTCCAGRPLDCPVRAHQSRVASAEQDFAGKERRRPAPTPPADRGTRSFESAAAGASPSEQRRNSRCTAARDSTTAQTESFWTSGRTERTDPCSRFRRSPRFHGPESTHPSRCAGSCGSQRHGRATGERDRAVPPRRSPSTTASASTGPRPRPTCSPRSPSGRTPQRSPG